MTLKTKHPPRIHKERPIRGNGIRPVEKTPQHRVSKSRYLHNLGLTPKPLADLVDKILTYPYRSSLPEPLFLIGPYTVSTIRNFLYAPKTAVTMRFVKRMRHIHENRDSLLTGLPTEYRYIIEDFLDHLFVALDPLTSPPTSKASNPHVLASSLGNYPDKPMSTVPPLASYQPPPTGGGQTLPQPMLDHFNHINTCAQALDIRRAVFLHFSRASNSSLGTRNYWPPKFMYHGPSYLAKRILVLAASDDQYAETYWAVCHAFSGRGVMPALYHRIVEVLGKIWSKGRTLRRDPVPYPATASSLDKFIDGPGNLIFHSQNYLSARHYFANNKPSGVDTHLAYSTPGEKIAEDWGLVTKFLGSKMYHWLCGMTLNNPVAYLDSVSGEYTRESIRVKIYKDDVPLYDWRKVFLGKRDPNIYEVLILAAVWIDSFESVAAHGMEPETTMNSDTLFPDLGTDLDPLLMDVSSKPVYELIWCGGAKTLVDAAVEQFTSFGSGPTAVDMAHRLYGRYLTNVICQLLGKDVSDGVKEDQALAEEHLSFRPHRSIELDARREVG